MENKSMMEELKTRMKELIKEQSIICPYCDIAQDTETRNGYVTYWGDDEEQECECGDCGKTFWVKENVRRTFKTHKLLLEEG